MALVSNVFTSLSHISLYSLSLLFYKNIFLYLFERQRASKREKEREINQQTEIDTYIHAKGRRERRNGRERKKKKISQPLHFPKNHKGQDFARSKPEAWSQELNPSHPYGWQGPCHLSHHLFPLSVYISMKLQ